MNVPFEVLEESFKAYKESSGIDWLLQMEPYQQVILWVLMVGYAGVIIALIVHMKSKNTDDFIMGRNKL